MSTHLPALDAVAELEREVVEEARLPVDLRALVDEMLGGPETVSGGGEPLWAQLPLLACISAAGETSDVAVPLAAAVEIQTAAYRLLDDIEDGDVNGLIRRAGLPVACNLATTLLALAQRVLLRVPATAADIMVAGWLAACAGQHDDLTLCNCDGNALPIALRAAKGKTAAIAGAAAEAGALLGGARSELAARYRQFGRAVGLAGQLANDLRGLRPGPDGATDVSRGQLTLPVLFALGTAAPVLRASLEGSRAGNPPNPALHAQALAELTASGAHRFVWLLREDSRREAAAALGEIARDRPVCGTLDRLLPASRIGVEVSP